MAEYGELKNLQAFLTYWNLTADKFEQQNGYLRPADGSNYPRLGIRLHQGRRLFGWKWRSGLVSQRIGVR